MKRILLICVLSVSLFSQTVYTLKNTETINEVTMSIDTKKPINGIMKKYYKTGELNRELEFIDGKGNGIGKWYYKTGELKCETPYKNGEINGIKKTYYETGKLKGEIQFKDGQVDGIAKDYYRTGKLKQEIEFKYGKVIQGFKYTRDGKKTKMTNAHFHNMGLKY